MLAAVLFYRYAKSRSPFFSNCCKMNFYKSTPFQCEFRLNIIRNQFFAVQKEIFFFFFKQRKSCNPPLGLWAVRENTHFFCGCWGCEEHGRERKGLLRLRLSTQQSRRTHMKVEQSDHAFLTGCITYEQHKLYTQATIVGNVKKKAKPQRRNVAEQWQNSINPPFLSLLQFSLKFNTHLDQDRQLLTSYRLLRYYITRTSF